ncbi:MAG: pyridoxamine 5'-phosphate oxidase family protein [Candidatus Binatia bacterium]
MTDEEVRAFLTRKSRLVLGTLGSDGAPCSDVTSCVYERDRLYALVPRDGDALANLRRDPRVCCIVEEFPSYFEIKGVIVHARASEASGEERERAASRFPAGSGERFVVVRIPLERVVSFDFAKIQRRF